MKTQIQEESHVKTEAEIRVMRLEAEEHQSIASHPRKSGDECGTGSFSESPVGTNPAHTLISDFWPPEL